MKQIKLIPLILCGALLFLFSCSEEWLKPDPLSFYAPENVFVDESGFEAALVVCKKQINNDQHGLLNPICTEYAYSDLALSRNALDFSLLTPSDGGSRNINGILSDTYKYIKNCNTIISRIDQIEWTDQSNRNRILSEALWFRAYWYYRMVHTYGDIPWIGHELKGAKLDFYSTSHWTILEKLKEDLEFAESALPVNPEKPGDVTKGAVNHLLTKVYLSLGEFDNAITSSTEVINGPYALMTERFGIDADKKYYNLMWDLNRSENINDPANTETIYSAINPPEAPAEAWSPATYLLRNYAAGYWGILDSEGQRATNWNTPAGDTLGLGAGFTRPTWYYRYTIWEDENNTWETTSDMRRADANWIEMGDSISEITVVRENSPEFGQPLEKAWFTNLEDTTFRWYSWPQYKLYVPITANNYRPYGGLGDLYVFRLAETYLLRAEAYYWKGQTGLAASDINKVRQRANAPLISSEDVTIDYIFDERARELFTEEPRHSEMVRVSFLMAKLNLNGYSLETISEKNWYYDRVIQYNEYYTPPKFVYRGYTATLSPHNMLWPISQSLITANTLGTINQNYGYQGYENNVPPLTTIPKDEEVE